MTAGTGVFSSPPGLGGMPPVAEKAERRCCCCATKGCRAADCPLERARAAPKKLAVMAGLRRAAAACAGLIRGDCAGNWKYVDTAGLRDAVSGLCAAIDVKCGRKCDGLRADANGDAGGKSPADAIVAAYSCDRFCSRGDDCERSGDGCTAAFPSPPPSCSADVRFNG